MDAATPDTKEPLRIVQRWLDRAAASGLRRNPNAMALATVGSDGRPSVRMVLLKALAADAGYVVFYTHYRSRKGQELEHCAFASAALYWEEFGRQVRLEGRVLRAPDDESDAYFASRPLPSQVNAWVSAQSEELADPGELERRAAAKAREFEAGRGAAAAAASGGLPRPPFWGGYRLWCDAVELWMEGSDRFHTRLRYQRVLTPDGAAAFRGGDWHGRRLQP